MIPPSIFTTYIIPCRSLWEEEYVSKLIDVFSICCSGCSVFLACRRWENNGEDSTIETAAGDVELRFR